MPRTQKTFNRCQTSLNAVLTSVWITLILPAWSLNIEGVLHTVSARNLLPDTVASSVPVSAFHKNHKAGSQLDNRGLVLRSSSHNVSGIGGYPLFALPIMSSDLVEILNKAQADLQSRNGNMFASSYHVNTTKWSFLVVIANTTLRYGSIQSVISRFLKLSTATAASHDIVSTRVGVIFNGSVPIADITIVPCRTVKNSSYIPFSNFGNHSFSMSQPTEIVKVTPFGSSCVYKVVDESSALAPFRISNAEKNLTARSIESEILVRVGESIYAMSVHLWQNEDGLPVEVKIWALKALIFLAYWQILIAACASIFGVRLMADIFSDGLFDAEWGLDTGFYSVGHLMGRLVIRTVQAVGYTPNLSLQTWEQILATLLKPLQTMDDYYDAWAMEGEIYGPGNAAGHGNSTESDEERTREVVARWQMWMGDWDDYKRR